MPPNTHHGHRERLRNRYMNAGLAAFADHEVLEFLLCYSISRGDVNPTAHDLLKKFGTLQNVFQASQEELMTVKGIGERSALLIHFIGNLTRRIRIQSMGSKIKLNTPQLAGTYASELLADKKIEVFYIFLLDNQQRLIKTEKISEGTPSETFVKPRIIVELALLNKATFVILAHNHPSGSIQPSLADLKLTEHITNALQYINVVCAEHIIVAGKQFFSIKTKQILTYNENQDNILHEEKSRLDPYKIIKQIQSLNAEDLSLVVDGLDTWTNGFDPDNFD